MPKVLKTSSKLRCKECQSEDLEILEVKQGKNTGRKYAVCDNGCTSINKQTGKRGKKWVDWVDKEKEPEESSSEEQQRPPPKKRQREEKKPEKRQKKAPVVESSGEESSGEETLELDPVMIKLGEIQNGQRQLQEEVKTVHSRMLLLYSKLPGPSQGLSFTPADGNGNILPSQRSTIRPELMPPGSTATKQLATTLSQPSPLFTIDGVDFSQ
jgi:hypothetical protein